MALLTWSSKYSVGVKALDQQHSAFMEILNQLHAAMMAGKANSIAGPLLKKLADQSRDHFAAEESLFEATKYPELARHRALHLDGVKQIEDFTARFNRGDNTLYLPLLRSMRDWLSDHVLTEDKKYSQWFTERGIR